MENQNEIVSAMETLMSTLISLGGPGVAIAVMVYFFNKQSTMHGDERKEWKESDQKSREEFVGALKENTMVTSKLVEKIESGSVCNYRKAS